MRYMQRRVIDLLPLHENLSFLDLGCGTGWAVGEVARRVNQRGEFYGIDLAPKMIERAKENSRDLKNLHFEQANAEELPFQNDLFDLALCTNSFHHYPHPAIALNEIRRVLKPGGRIYIMDFTADGLIARKFDQLVKSREPEHVKFHSTREFDGLFADAKLKPVATQSIISLMKVHVGEKYSPA